MVDRVDLYRAPSTVCDVDAIGTWLEARIDADVAIRDRYLDVHRTDDLAEGFAAARVTSPYDRDVGNTMLGVVRYEERMLDAPERAGGVLYDARTIQRSLNVALPAAERSLDRLHVPVLDRVIGSWGEHDGRWHKRVNYLGQPAIVSVPGLYEAPAKPEEYYELKQQYALASGDAPPREVLESEIEADFLVVEDPRTTAALKGYVLQAVHLLETGESFCDDPRCRLSNPHRQAGVIEAQLEPPEFCQRHAALYGG